MKTTEHPQYITQINAFHRFTECSYLPPNAQILWFKLIHLCNTCGWQEWVQVDARRIMRWIGAANEKTAYRARDALVHAGLLEYRKGHKGCPNRYRLRYFEKDPHRESGSQSGSQYGSQSGSQYGSQYRSQSGANAGHINRQDTDQTRQEYKDVPAELSEVFGAYVDMRRKMRKPLTDAAARLLLRTLETLAPNRADLQRQILEQSILNGWAGVYPLKKEEAPEPPASYDIEELERRLLYGKIEYEKRDKS